MGLEPRVKVTVPSNPDMDQQEVGGSPSLRPELEPGGQGAVLMNASEEAKKDVQLSRPHPLEEHRVLGLKTPTDKNQPPWGERPRGQCRPSLEGNDC